MVQRLTRAQWGALPPKRPQTRLSTAAGVTIHYEGPRMGAYAHSTCIGKVRGIQRFHMDGTRDNWKDVAYNEIVCRHGVRFECRGYGNQGGANGNSAANASSYAICALIGDGDDVTPELVAGIADAAADYRRHGAGPKVWGHRDHIATSCPGNPLYALVKAGAFSGNKPAPTAPSKSPAPTPATPPKSEEDTVFMVQVKGKDPVYKTDGFRRIHIDKTQRDALLKAGVRLVRLDSDAEMDAFGAAEVTQ